MTLGVIVALFGLAVFLVGALWDTLQQQPEFTDQLGDLPESFGTFALVLGLVVLVWAVLEIVAGIFVLGRRRWARITAIILAILGVLAGLASLLQGGTGLTYVAGAVWILFIAGHAFIIWALASNGRWFSRA